MSTSFTFKHFELFFEFLKNKEINFLILLNSVMVLGAWLNILYVSTI